MARIVSNPALEIEPNFASATFEALRNRIIGNTQTTHAEAANELTTGWQQDRDIRSAAWDQQVNEDNRLAAEEAQAERERLEQEQFLLEQEAENERRETEKKKPKINDFTAGASVSDTLTPRPSQYAIHKLKSFEYVELWYFSPDGCRETADEAKSSADGTFGFTKVEDFVALKPVASFKPSRKAIQDHSLDWRQFDLAKNSFLIYINRLNWPEKHQRAITMFFMNIVSHLQRSEPFGERALLLYAARVRRDWHDTLTLDNAFDISVFNLTLLKNLAEEIWNKARLDSLTEVRVVFPNHDGNIHSSYFPLSCFRFRCCSLLPASTPAPSYLLLLPLTCFRFRSLLPASAPSYLLRFLLPASASTHCFLNPDPTSCDHASTCSES